MLKHELQRERVECTLWVPTFMTLPVGADRASREWLSISFIQNKSCQMITKEQCTVSLGSGLGLGLGNSRIKCRPGTEKTNIEIQYQ